VKLAALYVSGGPAPGEPPSGGRPKASALHLATTSGYVSVDRLAASHGADALRGLADVGDLLGRGPDAMAELRALAAGMAPDAEADVAAAQARLAPPVRRPGKIICVGLNYLAHIEESRVAKPDRIVLFAKFASCLIGTGEPVLLTSLTSELDYEGELAVVIGKQAHRVSAERAAGYVAGYTVINDISARDLQREEPQWIRAKALDTFAPLGPVMLDAAAAPPPAEMSIRTTVNGEVRQDASCSLMITDVPGLIEYISQAMTLEPGDIIATGTPSGVALGMENPVYLAPGDEVTVTIPGIGELANVIETGK
jgi:2-keto-4-pentenoate hydratase/2-oxohepta-3-ene-1,7-dioic acid hydratase in catechol pathway